MKQVEVSRATIGRLPIYLEHLNNIRAKAENISATALARALGLGEVQVRKDLSAVSGAGRPKTGYKVAELIKAIRAFLNMDNRCSVVIIGAGKLGRALLDYGGFEDYGLEIEAAFDIAVSEKKQSSGGKFIYPMSCFAEFCKQKNVKIGIITVPKECAQETSDLLVESGVKAIWCFAPCSLSVPEGVAVQYENMALSLAFLNKKTENI